MNRTPAMAPPDAPTTRWAVARILMGHRSTHTVLASLVPLLVARWMAAGWSRADAFAALGVVLLWPVLEWIMHVAMHVPPLGSGRWRIDPRFCRAHRRHHDCPGVVDDLLLPPVLLASMAVLSWVAMPWLLGLRPGLSAALVFHAGGLLNGWVHLLTHSRVRPHTRYYAWIRKTHTLHHCKDRRRWFSFTGPWLDAWWR